MLPVLESAEVRRDHTANRTGIGRPVRVAPHILENGTHIQTGPATNAVQRIPLFRICQKLGPPVVQQHDMPFLWSIGLPSLAGTAVHRVVPRQGLARPSRGQHREK